MGVAELFTSGGQMDTDKRQALLAGTAARPSAIRIEMVQSGATATATLLWDQAPKTCAAIVASLPFSTVCWHGRNSGAEALCLTPTVISDLPQDESENATTEHAVDDLVFGYEPAGFLLGELPPLMRQRLRGSTAK